MSAIDKIRDSFNSDSRVRQARDWYQSQSTRDQLIVRLTAVFTALALIFLILVLPLIQQSGDLDAQLRSKLQFYNTMADNADRFSGAGGATAGAANTPLLGLVSQQARKSGVTLTRYEQDGDSLRVWVDGAPFDETIVWIENLSRQFGVRVSQINIDRVAEAGRVNVRATFSK